MQIPIYSMNAKFVKIEKIGYLKDGGNRINFHYIGELEGALQGSCSGVDYAIIYSDKVLIHIHEIITFKDNKERISLSRNGTGEIQQNGDLLITRGIFSGDEIKNPRLDLLKVDKLVWKACISNSSRNFFMEAYCE